jgi:hypothetical protein
MYLTALEEAEVIPGKGSDTNKENPLELPESSIYNSFQGEDERWAWL